MIIKFPYSTFALLLLAIFSLSSCDKIKQVADDVTSKVSGTLEERMEGEGEGAQVEAKDPVDNSLQELVDQTEEGVVFRKDLEFPSEIRVEAVTKRKISGRVFHQDETGKRVETVKGMETVTSVIERKGAVVDYTINEVTFTTPVIGAKDKPAKGVNPLRQAPPVTQTISFSSRGGEWKAKARGDFKLMSLIQQLSPVFDELLVENSLKPRPLWFSKSRLNIGDEITISDDLMPMLVTGKAKGSLKLKLEDIAAVHGHPCGVFSVSGEFSRQNFPDVEGVLINQEVTVESGKMWLSLVYPVILKQEFQTIQTFEPSVAGGLVGRCQGTVELSIERKWQAVREEPVPEEPVEETVEQPAE